MIKHVVLMCAFILSGQAYAEESCCKDCTPKQKVVKPKPKKIEKPKPYPVIKDNKEKIENNSLSTSTASTGNQIVTVNFPSQMFKPPVVYRLRTQEKLITKPNRFQILLGLSKTNVEVQSDCCSFKATNAYEYDIGVQYSRDIGGFTGSFIGTVNNSYYIGFGFNF
jgi:hypothetical protein